MNFKKTKSLITSLLLLIMGFSIMARKCNATTFQECYIPCYILCAIQPTHTLSYCAFECLRDCIIPTNNTHVTSFHFCNLGCASSHCTNISTLKKPGIYFFYFKVGFFLFYLVRVINTERKITLMSP